jgi:transcription elongation factor GreB
MSRAFTKERDDAPEPEIVPRRAQGSRAITPGGFAQLNERLKAATTPGERERLQRTLDAVRVVTPPEDRRTVAFGATVSLSGAAPRTQRYTIAGEDEVDIAHGTIGLDSPLARALMGAHVGDTVLWPRPSGDCAVTVERIGYPGGRRPAPAPLTEEAATPILNPRRRGVEQSGSSSGS